ncbi:DNA polymerase III subunit gamma and tau [Scardovia wiggsiae]|uniref:DNA polymerase III subunit gamma and tau n=1 Tax=Scardovia wiggsiae TaxID=230143 RepID=UPI003BAD77C4
MALALYRRYRPDTFDGVVGQDQVTIPLKRALDEGRLTHAYLFSGPRGCGKTSSARILARCINCAEGPTSHPCGKCDSCRDLAANGPGSVDVIEIDAASHNGVDDARELRERAGFAPTRDRYKIFILDEAHMVTQQGFNALLKVVEEPPEHVMFIFATTEPDKVIGTIRSRTHHYPFRLVPPEVMAPYLEEVCRQEKIAPENGVLKLTMRAGGGSVRDTLSVLDQLMAGAAGNKITYDSAVALLGYTPDTLISDAVDAVCAGDGARLYDVVEKVVVGGFDPRKFVEDLLSRVRDLLVLTLAGDNARSVLSSDTGAGSGEALHRQAQELGLVRLTSIAEIINDALAGMSGATSPRMRLELLAAQLLVPGRDAAGDGGQSIVPDSSDTSTAAQLGEKEAPRVQQRPAGANTDPRRGYVRPQEYSNRIKQQTGAPAARPAELPGQDQPVSGHSYKGGVRDPEDTGQEDTGSSVESSGGLKGSNRPDSTNGFHDANGSGDSDSPNISDRSDSPGSSNSSPEQTGPADASLFTPDAVARQWKALVAGLPQDIQAYVNETHIPHVGVLARGDMHRIVLRFADPLSQHAFALGVAKQGINGRTKVRDIIEDKCEEVFGKGVKAQPDKLTASGDTVTPISRMSDKEQQKVKAQIAAMAMAQTGAGDASPVSRNSSNTQPGKASPTEMEDVQDEDGDPWDTPVAKPQDAVQRKKGTSVASSAPAKAGSAGTHKYGPRRGGLSPAGSINADTGENTEADAGAVKPAGSSRAAASSDTDAADSANTPRSTDGGSTANTGKAKTSQSEAVQQADYADDDKHVDGQGKMTVAEVARMFDAKSVETIEPHNGEGE